MSFSDNEEDRSPVDGLGGEIMPERGLPFDDVEENNEETDLTLGAPREVSPDELASLFQNQEKISAKGKGSGWLQTDSGMGASEPIMTEADFEAQDIPDGGTGIDPQADLEQRFDSIQESGLTKNTNPPTLQKNQPAEEDLLVTPDRIARLWERIDQGYQMVKTKVPGTELAQELIEELGKARNNVSAGAEMYEEAERKINEVEVRIAVIERSKIESRSAVVLLIYEILWVTGLLIYFFSGMAAEKTTLIYLIRSAAWGGVAGAGFGIFALWKHVSRDMDFKRQYNLWYAANPIIGILSGAFTFLLIKYVLLSMFLGPQDVEIANPFVVYILAFGVAYFQNSIWKFVSGLVKNFRRGRR